MREASVKAAHIVEEARKKVEDEKDELIRVQTAAADFKAKLIELYREHIELVTRIPVTDSTPVEEPAAEEPTPEETSAAEICEAPEDSGASGAVPEETVMAAEEATAEHDEEPIVEELIVSDAEPVDDIPEAGKDIFAEFEKTKQKILNFETGDQKDSDRRSKFEGLKFGNDFNLMDDEDEDF